MVAQEIEQDLLWMNQANCSGVDPTLFTIQKPRDYRNEALAKQICSRCIAREECLEYALMHENERGMKLSIWGGKTYQERLQVQADRISSVPHKDPADWLWTRS